MQKKQRILKLQAITYKKKWKPSTNYPNLQLKGKWLLEAGFGINQYVKITIQEELLIIEPLKD